MDFYHAKAREEILEIGRTHARPSLQNLVEQKVKFIISRPATYGGKFGLKVLAGNFGFSEMNFEFKTLAVRVFFKMFYDNPVILYAVLKNKKGDNSGTIYASAKRIVDSRWEEWKQREGVN